MTEPLPATGNNRAQDHRGGVIAVLHAKGGSGGDVVTWGLLEALATHRRKAWRVDLDDSVGLRAWPNHARRHTVQEWSKEVLRVPGGIIVVANHPVLIAPNPQIDEADVLVYVTPVDPVAPPAPGEKDKRLPEEIIDPLVADDPRLLVVVNDGAGADPKPPPTSGEPNRQHPLRVPFDQHLQRGLPAPRYDDLDPETTKAFNELAHAVTTALDSYEGQP